MSVSDRFPPDFTFGVATAAYQVEGGIENDWSAWERAGKLKEPHARCGKAVDHWGRFDDDVQLIRDVGATAYRLSLEWARIEPKPGEFDESALQGYRSRLERLRQSGIRPVVTLHHFTNPPWLHEQAPWHGPDILPRWERYVRACAQVVRGLDAAIITFNEPMVFLLGGYLQGLIPPGRNSGVEAMAALANIARAHVLAREALRESGHPLTAGISQHLMVFAADRRWHPIDQAVVRLAEGNFNHALLEALCTGQLKISMPGVAKLKATIDGAASSMEFVGINYYTRAHLRFITKPPFVHFGFRDVSGRGLTDIGWEDYSEGFGDMLRAMKRYKLPVWVTENGIDDRTGKRRPEFLYRHWQQLLAARADGVDVRAYLHWSLLDNFEWLEAWGPRFGLYRVDFDTLERTPTPAVPYFKQVATSRTLIAP